MKSCPQCNMQMMACYEAKEPPTVIDKDTPTIMNLFQYQCKRCGTIVPNEEIKQNVYDTKNNVS